MILLYGEWVPSALGLATALLVALLGTVGIGFYVVRRLPPADL